MTSKAPSRQQWKLRWQRSQVSKSLKANNLQGRVLRPSAPSDKIDIFRHQIKTGIFRHARFQWTTSLFSEAPPKYQGKPRKEDMKYRRQDNSKQERWEKAQENGERKARVNGAALEEGSQSLQERGFIFIARLPCPVLFILLCGTRFLRDIIFCTADLLVMNSFNFLENVYLDLLLRDIFPGYKILD